MIAFTNNQLHDPNFLFESRTSYPVLLEAAKLAYSRSNERGLASKLLLPTAASSVIDISYRNTCRITRKQTLSEVCDSLNDYMRIDRFLFSWLRTSEAVAEFGAGTDLIGSLLAMTNWMQRRQKTCTFVAGSSIVSRMLCDAYFSSVFAPSKNTDTAIGLLGTVLGFPTYTDCFRSSDNRVIGSNEIWCLPAPDILGHLRKCPTTAPDIEVIDDGSNADLKTVNWSVYERNTVSRINADAVALIVVEL